MDRIYLGRSASVGQLLTLGGAGVQMIVDWFLIRKAAAMVSSATLHEIR